MRKLSASTLLHKGTLSPGQGVFEVPGILKRIIPSP